MKKYLLFLIVNIFILNIYAQDNLKLTKTNQLEAPVNLNNSVLVNIEKTIAIQNYILNDVELSFSYLVIPYLANDAYVPSISISYYHRIKKWLWLGTQLNFNYVTPFTDGINAEVVKNKLVQVSTEPEPNYECFGIAPTVRFSYVNKPNFLLYSGLTIGLQMLYNERNLSIASVPFFQTILLGFSYGKNLYLGGEIGAGFKGILNVNVGYRF